MKLLPLKLIQIQAREFWGRKNSFWSLPQTWVLTNAECWDGWTTCLTCHGWQKWGYNINICSFYCMESWPTQQRHWSSVCGDQIKVNAPFQRDCSSPRHSVNLLGGETQYIHKKWGSFFTLLQGLLPCHREFSAHCMSCCFQSWQELKFCRAGVGLWNRNWESRGKGWKFSAQTLRRPTPFPMSDVSCAPSGDRRQGGAPIFPLNSMACDQHCWCLCQGYKGCTQRPLGPGWKLTYLSKFIAAESGGAQHLWVILFILLCTDT